MLITGLLLLSHAATPALEPRVEGAARPSHACLAIQVEPSPGAPVTREARFSAAQVLDLRISALFARSLRGPHYLELRVYTPQGFLYQKLAVPFDATPPPSDRQLRSRALRSAGARLPVTGTSITTSSLYGRWTVVPFLDGGADPCGKGRAFVIEQ